MLPDYPGTKTELASRLQDFLRARVASYLGPLSEIRVRRVFEGDTQVLTRTSGVSEEIRFNEMRAGFALTEDEIPSFTIPKLLKKLDEVAEQLASQQAKHTYSSISQAVEAVGNVVDATGRSTAEAFLESISQLQIEFSPEGTPRMPQIHIHPSQAKGMESAIEELESRPDLRRDFDRIMVIKKEEWRAREASRKLVG